MNKKTIVTVLLLGLVVVSVAALVVKELGAGGEGRTVNASEVAEAAADSAPQEQLLVYYFHGNKRCVTCLTIEAYLFEVVDGTFADLRRDGRLDWQAVNVDQPENEHFVPDYQLSTSSAVLSFREGGKEVRWKNLERVWELVDQKAMFDQYIRTEVESMLMGEGSGS